MNGRINTLNSSPGQCANIHQGQNHLRDFGRDGVPHREPRHTQGHQARKHFSGQGFSHQGIIHIEAHDIFVILTASMYSRGNQSILFLLCVF